MPTYQVGTFQTSLIELDQTSFMGGCTDADVPVQITELANQYPWYWTAVRASGVGNNNVPAVLEIGTTSTNCTGAEKH